MISGMAHPVFQALDMTELSPETFDGEVLRATEELTGVFFWGHDCPNCDVAKAMLLQDAGEVRALGLRWFHVNTYDHFDLGTRFGLFGIPTFLFFRGGKKLGRISPFPGMDPFLTALRDLQNRR